MCIYNYVHLFIYLFNNYLIATGVTVRTLDLWSRGCGFNSRSGRYQVDGWLSVDR